MQNRLKEALDQLKSPTLIKIYELPRMGLGGFNWVCFGTLRGVYSTIKQKPVIKDDYPLSTKINRKKLQDQFTEYKKERLMDLGSTVKDLKSTLKEVIENKDEQNKKALETKIEQYENCLKLETDEPALHVPTIPELLGKESPATQVHELKKSTNELQVVLVAPRSDRKLQGMGEVVIKTQQLLSSMQSPFFNYPIHYNMQGQKYLLRADSTLEDDLEMRNQLYVKMDAIGDLWGDKAVKLVHPDKFSIKLIQTYMAQLILGLEVLHDNNYAHCDFTPNNILAFNSGSKYPHLQINDFDGLLELDEKGRPKTDVTVFAPDPYRAPEFYEKRPKENKEKSKKPKTTSQLKNLYHSSDVLARHRAAIRAAAPESEYRVSGEKLKTLDFRAVDCYALGTIFWSKILVSTEGALNQKVLSKENETKFNELEKLVDCLTEKNPSKRFTVKQAKNHAFFGDEKEREVLFKEVRDSYPQFSIDGHVVSQSIKPNDTFLLLPAKIKKVCQGIEELIAILNQDAKADVKTKVVGIKNDIQAALKDSEIKQYKSALNNALQAAQQHLTLSASQITLGFINQPHAANESKAVPKKQGRCVIM